ncbi:hypothetical protein SDC9_212895 [bioreactor metagenome]|jgi:hypothetical protein|uniref:Uncharacterized protein n=1 Tax=bioreactor metagenome TaxID=1076179 RepID=A0A645JP19_9ZZZZ
MKRRMEFKNLHALLEEHVFSSEELDLIQQRINEELEFDSTTTMRIRDNGSQKHRNADRGRF